MKTQFDIWEFSFPDRGVHSVVLISHPDLCARAKHVNVLYCTSQRQSRKPYPFEVMLDVEDGFNWETFCDCSAKLELRGAFRFLELFVWSRGRETTQATQLL